MAKNMADNRHFIKVDGISKTYFSRSDRVEALRDVSFEIREGEFVVVVGPSGCGKSTIMMIMAGLIEATSGRVLISDTEVNEPYTDLGVVFQNHLLLDWLTTIQNVLFPIDMRGLSKKQYEPRAQKLLEMVTLNGFEDKYSHELSGGMRQRAAICRALIYDPPLLLMDEPFGALDALTREQLCIDMEKIWLDSRKTVVFITHSIQEAVQLSDRVLVMTPRPGRICREIAIDLPRPRYKEIESDRFAHLAEEIRATFKQYGVLHE
ncbi:MAG TPA: ABC transporter ATP-binding protein [Spirochaetia bacterium]|nr:ABC transporter ATP-binding protein [Spirochaetia bacterium]